MITARTLLGTKFGEFCLAYHLVKGRRCISLVCGDITKGRPMVRVHSACLFGDALGSTHCDCGRQLFDALERVQAYGQGVIVYSCDQEGRGIGLQQKVVAMELQRTTNCDSPTAFAKLGFSPDLREYDAEVETLGELHLAKSIVLLTSNIEKLTAFRDAGYEVIEESCPRR